MKFSELIPGDLFEYIGYRYVKIEPILKFSKRLRKYIKYNAVCYSPERNTHLSTIIGDSNVQFVEDNFE